MTTKTLEQNAADWLKKKSAIKKLQKQLLEVEKDMLLLLETPEEGAKTTNIDGFKIVSKGVINRTLDIKSWDLVRESVPETLRPIKYTPKLDEVGVKWLRDNDPALYKVVSTCITAKPGKTNITVTKEEE